MNVSLGGGGGIYYFPECTAAAHARLVICKYACIDVLEYMDIKNELKN